MIKEYGNKLQTHNVMPSCDLVAEAWMKYGDLFNILRSWGFIYLQRVARALLIHGVLLRACSKGGYRQQILGQKQPKERL